MRRDVESILSHQKVRKEMQFAPPKKLDEFYAYQDLSLSLERMNDANSLLCECRRKLEESDVDPEYKNFLLHLLDKREFIPNKRRKENDDASQHVDDYYGEEENDPRYERFLKHLTKHEKSYVLIYEKNGLPVIIKYEAKNHLDEKCDTEPKKKLRSDVKQTIGPSNQMPDVGNQHKHGSQSTEGIFRHKVKIEEEENAEYTTDEVVPNSDNLTSCYTAEVLDQRDASLDKNFDPRPRTRLRSGMKRKSGSSNCMPSLQRQHKHDVQPANKAKNLTGKNTRYKDKSDMVPDSDYLNLLEHSEVINGNFVYTYEAITIVYENIGEEHIKVKQEHNDESHSDVEILDSTSVYKRNGNISNAVPTVTSVFRQQLIEVLKKPFNRKEYDKLWHDIKLHKPQERHMELRNGRERSFTKYIDGKSYLDHYPDLKRKLLQFKDDKPKCLNLLRGFFFWLQNSPLDKSFMPWKDAECIAIGPKSF